MYDVASAFILLLCSLLEAEISATGIRTSVRPLQISRYFVIPHYSSIPIWEQKAAWIPYFPDITALIFLAPVSSFNERLPENPRINRLEDTFALWKTVCSSKLLTNVQLVSCHQPNPVREAT